MTDGFDNDNDSDSDSDSSEVGLGGRVVAVEGVCPIVLVAVLTALL